MSRRTTIHAFTLVEMAIVLAIVGLMLGFGIQAFESGTGLACYDKAEQQMRVINEALQRFVATNNRLPKPAYMDYGANNPQFGSEPATVTAVDAHGYATEVPSGMVAISGVLIGQLPHASLGLSQDYSSDCWGSKFTYAVTNAMTSANATNGYPATADGVIELYSNSLATGVLQSDKIAYLVISHGMNKFGATPLSYNDIAARNCNGSASTIIDRENCDTAAGGNINFWSSLRNTGSDAGANYFDDVVIHNGNPMPLSIPSGRHLYCWGKNDNGQLGNGTNIDSAIPTLVELPTGVTRFVSVSVGDTHTCALSDTGQAYCWGTSATGELGIGNPPACNPCNTPQLVTNPVTSPWQSISAGKNATCAYNAWAVKSFCWGSNKFGKLGDGTFSTKFLPTEIPPPFGETALTDPITSTDFTCAISYPSAHPFCWGSNLQGQLGVGDGSLQESATPQPVLVPIGLTELNLISTSVGRTTACGWGYNGENYKLYCWGSGSTGNNSAYTLSPTLVAGAPAQLNNPFGGNHQCAALSGSGTYCWGDNTYGQYGSTTPSSINPTLVNSLWVQGVGADHTCATDSSHRLYCFGRNDFGQLGNGTTINTSSPTLVTLPSGKTKFSSSVDGGLNTTCAFFE